MPGSTFQTNPEDLHRLLEQCANGHIQLPDFQRSWVWDEDRIKSLIASVSRAFPVGALMTLVAGGEVKFKPRPIEGAQPSAESQTPQSLLLDGQQRMTSLYQATLRRKVVQTKTPRNKKVNLWFYMDIRKCLDAGFDRDDAIIAVAEDRTLIGRGNNIVLDLSSPEKEFENLMFPTTDVFDWDKWQDGFIKYWRGDDNESVREEFRDFKNKVLENFKYYKVPVIALDRSTSKEAVCTVFEKVNTGGKPLDAFELVTAMYATDGHELRKDWFGDSVDNRGRLGRLSRAYRLADSDEGILARVANTDFLHVCSLFHTRELRRFAENSGKQGKELPQVTGKREALLNLPLAAYQKYESQAEAGFLKAAKFLHMQHIYRIFDLPYQTQIVPLAAILADIGDDWELAANRAKIARWYWCGVLGELYGSAVDTRISLDFMQVPEWVSSGGAEPASVRDASFRTERLQTMRMRISAAYKGVNALLMLEGARDFRSGQKFDHTIFFGENVDIHHIFPQKWCKDRKINPRVFDSIINKTPLSYRTNRIIGGGSPSSYLEKLLKEPGADTGSLDQFLKTHLIDPELLREDRFEDFMDDRQAKLLVLIERAMGKASEADNSIVDFEDEADEDGSESASLLAAI